MSTQPTGTAHKIQLDPDTHVEIIDLTELVLGGDSPDIDLDDDAVDLATVKVGDTFEFTTEHDEEGIKYEVTGIEAEGSADAILTLGLVDGVEAEDTDSEGDDEDEDGVEEEEADVE